MGRKPLESLSQIVAAEGGSFGLHFEIVRVEDSGPLAMSTISTKRMEWWK